MNNNIFKDFLQKIRVNDNIDDFNKEKLIHYLANNLFSNVRVFTAEEYAVIESILEDYNYDVVRFSCLLENSNKIRNSFARKNGVKSIPKTDYVLAVKKIFDDLGMDLIHYPRDFEMANIAMGRCAYNIIFDNGLLNGETSFLEVTKEICDRYYQGKDINRSACKVIKQLNKIEKGFRELEEKYTGVVPSEEFYSMFELDNALNDLHLSDIIAEFYPVFKNDLFILVKKAVEASNSEVVKTEEVIKYLRNVKDKKEVFNQHKTTIINGITKIDLDLQKNTAMVFVDLLESIKGNTNINEETKNSLLNNISRVFNEYKENQKKFASDNLDAFFKNCTNYINNLILTEEEKISGIDGLISSLLDDCKDFFIAYDSKKFKEIVNFAINNTDISMDDLKTVSSKCSRFFKDADIEKIKTIKSSLKEFRNYVSKTFNDKELVGKNVFESILVSNPEFMLKNNKINELMKFFKGEVSLNEYGYVGSDFRLDKDFLGHKFYKRIVEDNYNLLFEGNLGMMANNLKVLDELCASCEINFRDLSINEDMIYTLLNNDLYKVGTNSLFYLKSMFNSDELKILLENNPDLLMVSSSDIEFMMKRSLLNETHDYNFYDLFISELYGYKYDGHLVVNEEKVLDKPFRYVDLGINTNRKVDVMEIVTSDFIVNDSPDALFKSYKRRKNGQQKINKLLKELSKKGLSVREFNDIAKKVVSLYTALYSKVSDVNLKNEIIEVISEQKEKYEYKISDHKEELEAKAELLAMYSKEKKEEHLIKEEIVKLFDRVNSDVLKDDLALFIDQLNQKRVSETEKKELELTLLIGEIKHMAHELDKGVEYLDYLLLSADTIEDSFSVDEEIVSKKSFKVKDLANGMSSSKSNLEKINELMAGENLILFADSVNLAEIPNDRNFVDKVNKFLGDNEFSIKSVPFMKANSFNKDFVEKFSDHRACIWSRRESRTPVRVYFIPIHTKYFTAYYVVHVNFKDHNHLDGGCSTDAVYNRRVSEAQNYEQMINNLSYDELVKFIRESKENYELVMKPIVSKVESSNKKRNNKK